MWDILSYSKSYYLNFLLIIYISFFKNSTRNISKKFQNKLQCVCDNNVLFEVINEIECDFGVHTVIQCTNCQELFSVDKKCSAFKNIFELLKINTKLYFKKEKFDYLSNYHPF